jgi:hypothetical protein
MNVKQNNISTNISTPIQFILIEFLEVHTHACGKKVGWDRTI